MSYRITFKITKNDQRGRTISVEKGEKILKAALDQGIQMRFGCGAGSCGLCVLQTDLKNLEKSPIQIVEQKILKRLGFDDKPNVRLGCQLQATQDMTLILEPEPTPNTRSEI